MEHVRSVQVRRRDPLKSMKHVLAQIDTKPAELDVGVAWLRACELVFIFISFVSCVISSSIVLDVGSEFPGRHLTSRTSIGF